MKRYLLFLCWDHDTTGGWHEFAKSFDTIEDAKAYAAAQPKEYRHIVDIEQEKITLSYDYGDWTLPDGKEA